MKSFIRIIPSLIPALLLAGCMGAQKDNGLLKYASPDTSALALYYCDGQKTTRSFLYDNESIRAVLKSLSAVTAEKADDFTPECANAPIYGISICSEDGTEIQAAVTSGFWIAKDGTAYRFDYDFDALAQNFDWTDTDTWESTDTLPCARYLCQDAFGWHTSLLMPAKPLTSPEHISATLCSQKDDTLTVSFQNQGEAEWSYGEYFTLQARIDDVWYVVPPMPGEWGFHDIAHILPAGTAQEETYSLAMYGSLPDGIYRLVAENLAVEFELP